MSNGRRKKGSLMIVAKRFSGGTFGSQSSYLRGLIAIGRRRGLSVFVAEPRHLHGAKNGRIRGWIPGRRGWVPVTRNWPGVVYDRAWGLNTDQQKRLASTLGRWQTDHGIPHFNPYFGNKWDVYNELRQHPELATHLPETVPLTADHLHRMGDKYPLLYVKPISGRQGKGICIVSKSQNAWVVGRRVSGGRSQKVRRATAEGVIQACTRPRVPSGFILQQGLSLLRVDGRSTDVRAIAQRNEKGRWTVTGIGVRIGPRGGYVSNLHAGGRAATLSALNPALRRAKVTSTLGDDIRRLVLKVSTFLTRSFPTLGEIGVDIGIDGKGHCWIIEINRQPGRALFARARLRTAWHRSRRRIVDFAQFLMTVGIDSHSALLPHSYDGKRGGDG